MKVLFVNEFTGIKGGVDITVETEIEHLRKTNVNVSLYKLEHNTFNRQNLIEKSYSIMQFLNRKSQLRKLIKRINTFEPDIIHFHNIFPLWAYIVNELKISTNIKVVQHLHNYYHLCLNSFFYRDDKTCTKCLVNKNFLPGVKHKCYNHSYAESLIGYLLRNSFEQNRNGTRKVDMFIAVSDFVREKYIATGFDSEKIITLNNSIVLDKTNVLDNNEGYVLYLGNIVKEKGVDLLCSAADRLRHIKFVFAGLGRDLSELKHKFRNSRNINFKGYVQGGEKEKLLKNCIFLVLPSLCWESFGIVILEAFQYGKPVLGSNMGAIPELVKHKINGMLIDVVNIENIQTSIQELWDTINNNGNIFKNECLKTAEKYTCEIHAKSLINIYNKLLKV